MFGPSSSSFLPAIIELSTLPRYTATICEFSSREYAGVQEIDFCIVCMCVVSSTFVDTCTFRFVDDRVKGRDMCFSASERERESDRSN